MYNGENSMFAGIFGSGFVLYDDSVESLPDIETFRYPSDNSDSNMMINSRPQSRGSYDSDASSDVSLSEKDMMVKISKYRIKQYNYQKSSGQYVPKKRKKKTFYHKSSPQNNNETDSDEDLGGIVHYKYNKYARNRLEVEFFLDKRPEMPSEEVNINCMFDKESLSLQLSVNETESTIANNAKKSLPFICTKQMENLEHHSVLIGDGDVRYPTINSQLTSKY